MKKRIWVGLIAGLFSMNVFACDNCTCTKKHNGCQNYECNEGYTNCGGHGKGIVCKAIKGSKSNPKKDCH